MQERVVGREAGGADGDFEPRGSETLVYGRAQILPGGGYAAGYDDHRRIQGERHVGKTQREIARHLTEGFARGLVPTLSVSKHGDETILGILFAGPIAVPGCRVTDEAFPTAMTAAGAQGTVGIDDHVPELGDKFGVMTAVELASDDGARAGAEIADVEEGKVFAQIFRGVVGEPEFGERAEVAIVVDADVEIEPLANFTRNIEGGQVGMGGDPKNASGVRVDMTRNGDANAPVAAMNAIVHFKFEVVDGLHKAVHQIVRGHGRGEANSMLDGATEAGHSHPAMIGPDIQAKDAHLIFIKAETHGRAAARGLTAALAYEIVFYQLVNDLGDAAAEDAGSAGEIGTRDGLTPPNEFEDDGSIYSADAGRGGGTDASAGRVTGTRRLNLFA